MPKTVSLDMAKRLKAAGLKWDLKVGDKYWLPCPANADDGIRGCWDLWVNDGLFCGAAYDEDELKAVFLDLGAENYYSVKPDAVWLPTLGDLLGRIKAAGYRYNIGNIETDTIGIGLYHNDYRAYIVGFDAENEEDAAGAALEWAMQRGAGK